MGKRIGLGFAAFLAVGVALFAPVPWLFGFARAGAHDPPLVAHLLDRYTAAQWIFVAHVGGGGLALLVMPWQFVRKKRDRIHRVTGYVYVSAIAIGGTAGFAMALHAFGGPIAQVGFAGLAIAWLTTTGFGLQRILAGDRAGHRAWMTRSFAITFAAVTLRLEFPLMDLLGVPGAYTIVAWSCWVPNLLVAQALVRRKSAGALPVQRRNARVNELCSENPSR